MTDLGLKFVFRVCGSDGGQIERDSEIGCEAEIQGIGPAARAFYDGCHCLDCYRYQRRIDHRQAAVRNLAFAFPRNVSRDCHDDVLKLSRSAECQLQIRVDDLHRGSR